MGRLKAWRKKSIVHARTFKSSKAGQPTFRSASPISVKDPDLDNSDENIPQQDLQVLGLESDVEEDNEVTKWTGGVNHDNEADDGSDFSWWEESSDDSSESEDSSHPDSDDEESEDDGWRVRLQKEVEHELQLLKEVSPFTELMKVRSSKDWKAAESKRPLGYNGQSARTQRRKDKGARDKEVEDAKLRKTKGAHMMRQFITPKPTQPTFLGSKPPAGNTEEKEKMDEGVQDGRVFTGYISDLPDDVAELENEVNLIVLDSEDDDVPIHEASPGPGVSETTASQDPNPIYPTVRNPPPLKRRRLDIPARVARQNARKERLEVLQKGLVDIERLIASKRVKFAAGREGLQAHRARAIQAYLLMVVKNGRKGIDASERAAEVHGFSAKWGARMVRIWVRQWLEKRALPGSSRGCHIKSYTLLEDPAIRAELRSYLRSNKWTNSPAKLVEFSQQKMIPEAAKKYLEHVVEEEMPRALKKYMEIELFPRIRQKVGKGISLETARKFLHKEGFRYVEHKKSLYYDGHERPDVVEYRQSEFIPQMDFHRRRLVEYKADNLEEEVPKTPQNFVERRLVLVPQDEMTAQANDGRKKSWVLDGEQPLKKKGVGRGIHQSDVICSTIGWLKEASQTIEYGKNYDGYWNGEMFVKQLREKIIPAFERAHGPGYQALIMVDKLQLAGTLPGGKQARLRNGWFFRGEVKVIQPMIFPPDHPEHPNEPKGMKQVLSERGLWDNKLRMECKKCPADGISCCAKRILELQPDFKAQKSLVQEVIESMGHLCIICPKFHCELNFIEYFWGAVKRYLREHCDYTFPTLQANMPIALASINKLLIRKWSNRMFRWIDAYRDGLNAKEAQFRVQAFSSKVYTSHRRIPERVAAVLD